MTQPFISVMAVGEVLLTTMPADPDDVTITALQDKVLRSFGQGRYTGLVLDISTVEIVDSFFARMIAETARMVSLMGGRTVIVGMRPSVAITTTQLGLTLGNARTALNMDQALALLSGQPLTGRGRL
jgi:rsbT antagonist protein RsbS